MSYLKLPRAQRVLLLILTSSLLLAWLPGLDLHVSSLFYRDGGFHLAGRWWATLLHECVAYFIYTAIAAVLGIYAFNRFARRNVCGVDGKVVGYLLAVLILGAGLIVNLGFKNHLGRARPRNVTEFGGVQSFTPAFVLANGCSTNCSFPSGDSAGAFFSLALVLALSRRRALLVAAFAFGVLVSFSRIASGAHFLSDTIISFFVMWIIADVLYFYLLQPRPRVVHPAPAAVRGYKGSPEWAPHGLSPAPHYARLSARERWHGAP